MKQEVELFGQQAVGAGTYLHQQTEVGLALRMELRLRFGERLTSLLQVSDGRTLWQRQDLADTTSLGRVDLDRLRSPSATGRQGTWHPVMTHAVAVGGLPRLMSGLVENFAFDEPQAAQVRDTAVWLLEGRWQKHVLTRLFPDQEEQILAGQPPDLTSLPEQMPTSVLVLLRQSDLFPLRIDYRRRGTDEGAAEGVADRSLLRVDLYDIRRGAPLDERMFIYQPGNQEFEDLTDRFLEQLRPVTADEEQGSTATR
jgi:hypothetical protein